MSVKSRLTSCLVVICVANAWLPGCLAQKVYDRVVEKNRERLEAKGGAGHKGIVCEKFRVTMWPKEDGATTGDESKPGAVLEQEMQWKLGEGEVNDRSTRNLKNARGRGSIEFDVPDEVPFERSWASFDDDSLGPLDATESTNKRPLFKKHHQAQRRREIKNYLVASIVNILIDVNNLMELNQKIYADLNGELIHRSHDGGCKGCRPALAATADNYMQAQFALCGTLERGLRVVELLVKEERKLLAIRNHIASPKRINSVETLADRLKSRLIDLLAIAEKCNDDVDEDEDRSLKINNLKKYLSSLKVEKLEILSEPSAYSSRHPSIKSASTALAPRRSYSGTAQPETHGVSSRFHDARRRIVHRKFAERIESFDYLMKFYREMPDTISIVIDSIDRDCLDGALFKESTDRSSISSSPIYDPETEVPEAAHGLASHGGDNYEDTTNSDADTDIRESDEFSDSNEPISDDDDDDDGEAILPGINRERSHHEISAAFSPSSFKNKKYSSTLLENDVFREFQESTIDSSSDDSLASDYWKSLFPYCLRLKKLRNQRLVDSYGDPLSFHYSNSRSPAYDSSALSDDLRDVNGLNYPSKEANGRVDLRLPKGKARSALGAGEAAPGDHIAIGLGHCTLIGKLIDGEETIDFRMYEAPLKSLKPNARGAGDIWKVPNENFVSFVSEDRLKRLRKLCQHLYQHSSAPRRYRYRRTSTVYEKDYDF